MTIPFGRRRLIVTWAVAAPPRLAAAGFPDGASDAEIVRFVRNGGVDIDRARWEGMTLIYGGVRRR